MKKSIFILLFVTVGLLAACGQSQDETDAHSGDDVMVQAIDVDLQAPETLDVDESVTIKAVVTQGGDAVDDAEYVEFEVWENGNKDASQMFEAEHQDGGAYVFTHSFTDEGLYFVQSHVQARDMHTMPIAEITVGEVEKQEE